MKILFLADLHLHEWPEFAGASGPYLNSRLCSQVDVLIDIFDHECPDVTVIAGDLVHNRASSTPAVMAALHEVVGHFSGENPTFVIPGNHDYPMKCSGELNHLVSLRKLPRVHIINEPVVPDFVGIGDDFFLFVPWHPSVDAMRKTLNGCKDKKNCVVVAHAPIAGCTLPNGYEYTSKSSLTRKDFQGFKAGFVGDFHAHQMITDTVMYVGAPYQLDRGDSGIAHGYGILEDGKPSWREWEESPRFVTVTVSDKDDLEVVEQLKAQGHYVTVNTDKPSLVEGVDGVSLALTHDPKKVATRLKGLDLTDPVRSILEQYADKYLPEQKDDLLVLFDRLEVPSRSEVSQEPVSILSARGHNFLCFEDVSLDFVNDTVLINAENLDDPTADNIGSGKSAIADLLFYGLTGKTLRDVAGDAIDNRFTGRPGHRVEISGTVGDKPFYIRRCRHWGGDNGVTVGIGTDKPVAFPNVNDGQRYVDMMLGLDADKVRQTMFFGQEAASVLSSASNEERKRILEGLCAGNRFDPYYESAKQTLALMSRHKAEATMAATRAQVQLEERAKTVERETQLAAQFNDWKTARIEEKKGILAGAKAALKKVEPGFVEEDFTEARQLLTGEIETLQTEVNLFREDRAAAQATVSQLESAGPGTSLARQIKSKNDALVAIDARSCPECGAPITDAKAELKRSQLQEELAELAAQVEERAEALATAKKKLADAESQLNVLRPQLASFEIELRKLDKQRADQEARLREISSCRAAIEQAEADLVHAETMQNLHAESAEQLKDSLIPIKAEAEELNEALVALGVEIERMDTLAKLFGNQGLRAFLFEQVIPTINEFASHAMSVLSDGCQSVELIIRSTGKREVVDIEVNNVYGADTYAGSSGGQKAKIDLALCWALHEAASGKFDMLIVDEAFATLDSVAAERGVKLLVESRKPGQKVLVMTHKSELKPLFSNVWTVIRKDKLSKVVVE